MAQATQTRFHVWGHRDFMLLWGGQSISMLGTGVTRWALPFAAIFTLNATPAQVGLLAAAGNIPLLLFGLVAGVWMDRLPRRPVLIVADTGRALLLGSIPLAAVAGRLTMTQLYLVAFLAGSLGVIFNIAYRSYLPSLVQRADLMEGNTRLEGSAQVAETVGPGLAGALVQVVTAPIAILADALSFVVSAASLALIHAREELHSAHSQSPSLLSQLRDGLGAVLRHPLLRPLAATSGLFNLFDSMLIAFYALYLTRVLGASAALSGVILVLSGLVGLVGVALAGLLPRRFGLGRTMVAAVFVAGAAELVIGLAQGPLLLAAGIVVLGEGLVQAAVSVYGINGVTLRQALVPDRLQGRVNATMQVISVGAAPLGALAATQLGALYGVRPVVLLAGIGTLFAFLVVLFSPVRTLDRHPDAAEEAAFAR